MSRSKRSIGFLAICFLMAIISALAAYADVIFEPFNNFFENHRGECEYINRQYYANGTNGSISLKIAPDSNEEVFEIENNEIITVSHTYNSSGKVWGVASILTPGVGYESGWVPMEQLLLVYDYISFAEEHQGEFYPYTGDYTELKKAEKIFFWTYPYSGVSDELSDIDMERFDENFAIDHVYKDEQGKEWGFVSWYYYIRQMWVCLSDPSNPDIPAKTTSPPTSDSQHDGETISPETVVPTFLVVTVIMVAVLVAGTAILIRIFWKPKNSPGSI